MNELHRSILGILQNLEVFALVLGLAGLIVVPLALMGHEQWKRRVF